MESTLAYVLPVMAVVSFVHAVVMACISGIWVFGEWDTPADWRVALSMASCLFAAFSMAAGLQPDLLQPGAQLAIPPRVGLASLSVSLACAFWFVVSITRPLVKKRTTS